MSSNKRKQPTPPAHDDIQYRTHPQKKAKYDDDNQNDTDAMPSATHFRHTSDNASPLPSSSTSDDPNDPVAALKREKAKSRKSTSTDTTSTSKARTSDTNLKRKKHSSPNLNATSPTPSSSTHSNEPSNTRNRSEHLSKATNKIMDFLTRTSVATSSALSDVDYMDPRAYPPEITLDHDTDTDPDTTHRLALRSVSEELATARVQNQNLSLDNSNLNNLLYKACDDLDEAKNENKTLQQDNERLQSDNTKMKDRCIKVGMDATLDAIRTKEDCKKKIEAEEHRRLKVTSIYETRLRQLREEHQGRMSELKEAYSKELQDTKSAFESLKKETDSLNRMHNEALSELERTIGKWSASEADAQTNRFLHRAAEEDLAEMARVKIKGQNEAQIKGLPPAYGSLDDDENLPPWARNEDRGKLHIALVKDTVRQTFKEAYTKAMKIFNDQRKSVVPVLQRAAPCELFRLLALALSDASSRLREFLAVSPSDAARVARLHLELCWELISAMTIRPTELAINRSSQGAIDVYWRNVDDNLAHALELAFRDKLAGSCAQCGNSACTGYCVRLSELQPLAEQLRAVQSRLYGLTKNFRFLVQTRGWVEEMLESDLMYAADAALPPTQPHSPAEEAVDGEA